MVRASIREANPTGPRPTTRTVSLPRELAAQEHKEPDRIPIDLRGCQTGIMDNAYNGMKGLLGIEKKSKILEIKQQLAVPNEEFLQQYTDSTVLSCHELNFPIFS